MVELGKYATEVLTAYGVTIALLVVLVAYSWRQSRKVLNELRLVEARRDNRSQNAGTAQHG